MHLLAKLLPRPPSGAVTLLYVVGGFALVLTGITLLQIIGAVMLLIALAIPMLGFPKASTRSVPESEESTVPSPPDFVYAPREEEEGSRSAYSWTGTRDSRSGRLVFSRSSGAWKSTVSRQLKRPSSGGQSKPTPRTDRARNRPQKKP